MSRKDWFITGVTAVIVAVMTVVLIAPPFGWAEPAAPVAIPSLPSTQLKIPSINTLVVATATPAPGEKVKVTLTVKAPVGSERQVPVTITVQSMRINTMSRSVVLTRDIQLSPQILTPQKTQDNKATQVSPPVKADTTVLAGKDIQTATNNKPVQAPPYLAQVSATVHVGIDGQGSAIVELPLVWAKPPAKDTGAVNTQKPSDASESGTTFFRMILSSPLSTQAVPTALQPVAVQSPQADIEVEKK